MSVDDTKWAYGLSGISAPEKAVLLALAYCRNGRTGKCFPSQQELVRMTELGERTVRASLKTLEQRGVIGRIATFNGRYRTNDEYTLNRDHRQEQPPATPASGTAGHRQAEPTSPATPAAPTGSTRRAVVPTGIQPEDNRKTFADFWNVWPRKDSKKDAATAWDKAVKRADADLIYAAAAAYATHPHRTAKQFVPYAATWLNKDRWNDPLPEAPESQHVARSDRNLNFVQQLQLADNSPKEIAS